jgi:hypothetical protein
MALQETYSASLKDKCGTFVAYTIAAESTDITDTAPLGVFIQGLFS